MSDVEYYRGLNRNSERAFYRLTPGAPTMYLRQSEYGRVVHPVSSSDEFIRDRRDRVPTGSVPLWAREGENGKTLDQIKAERLMKAFNYRYPRVAYRTTSYFVQAEAAAKAEANAWSCCDQPVPLTPEQLEAQRELYRATKAVTWGYLMGGGASPTGRFRVDNPALQRAVRKVSRTYLAEADDVVAGKGVISGNWRIGRLVQEETRWRGESLIEESDGVRCFVSTKTLTVVKKSA